MNITTFKEKLFAEGKSFGFTDCEIYYVRSNSFRVMVNQGEILQYTNTDHGGLSFRGTFGDRMGYSYTERIDDSIIPMLLRQAKENAEIIDEEERERLFGGSESYPQKDKYETYNKSVDELSVSDKIKMAFEMEKTALEADKRVVAVDYCVVTTGCSETYISNTLGLDLNNKSNIAVFYTNARVNDNQVKTGYDFWLGRDISKLDHIKVAKTAVSKAIAKLGATGMDSAEMNVVFQNEVGADLIEALSSVFYAENVQKGLSLMAGKLDTNVANKAVTIRDDGINEHSMGSVPFDCEGVATQQKAVIENGVLKTYLYNLKSAAKDGVKSTGNGFKPSFRASVVTACTNYYLQQGDISHDELLAKIGEGIYITSLDGLHAGVNSISGDFSLKAEGFLIENGKLSKPIELITVSGNFFKMLHNVEHIADDLLFGQPSATGTYGSPTFCAGRLSIASL
jgi:PmbA protein